MIVVERKHLTTLLRKVFLVRPHHCGFRFGGSGDTYDGTSYTYFFKNFLLCLPLQIMVWFMI